MEQGYINGKPVSDEIFISHLKKSAKQDRNKNLLIVGLLALSISSTIYGFKKLPNSKEPTKILNEQEIKEATIPLDTETILLNLKKLNFYEKNKSH